MAKKLVESRCDKCGNKRHMRNRETYCISCCIDVREKVKSLHEGHNNSGNGVQTAKQHWDNLPNYIRHDIIRYMEHGDTSIKGVSVGS